MLDTEGVRGFWRGNALTLGKIVPSVAINLVLFEQMQARLKTYTGVTGSSAAIDIVSGAVAGTVGTVATFPLDTLKVGVLHFFSLWNCKSNCFFPVKRPRCRPARAASRVWRH